MPETAERRRFARGPEIKERLSTAGQSPDTAYIVLDDLKMGGWVGGGAVYNPSSGPSKYREVEYGSVHAEMAGLRAELQLLTTEVRHLRAQLSKEPIAARSADHDALQFIDQLPRQGIDRVLWSASAGTTRVWTVLREGEPASTADLVYDSELAFLQANPSVRCDFRVVQGRPGLDAELPTGVREVRFR